MKHLFASIILFVVLGTRTTVAQPATCRTDPTVVTIFDQSQIDQLIEAIGHSDTIILLGPQTKIDFSGQKLPIAFGHCVTLTSVSSPDPAAVSRRIAIDGFRPAVPVSDSARTPSSPGPLLQYGKLAGDAPPDFFSITCKSGEQSGVHISGFRLFGPDFGYQQTNESGIHISQCIDAEISNMEIAGFGGAAVFIDDHAGIDPADLNVGPFGVDPNKIQVLVHGNYIHNNQQPSHATDCQIVNVGAPIYWITVCKEHAEGYGVNTGPGAWTRIYQNLFDSNRHAVAANGRAGGYWAAHNLSLKGGGYHGAFFNTYTHSFDVHGTGCWWSSDLCGDAGVQFWYIANAWQYRKDNDIKLRGTPKNSAYIDFNVFPFDDQGDAINTADNAAIGKNNVLSYDTYGHYSVCDFDGDGVDDLFLATGATWWFSSLGEFPWSYLNNKPDRLENLKLAYIDGDKRCDVVGEQNGNWFYSSGGVSDWKPLGHFGHPMKEVAIGRFDPRIRDHRVGVLLQATDAFWRSPEGHWLVAPLSVNAPVSQPTWKQIGGSSFPLDQLRFGDFNGDGVTDVLSVEGGHWSVSDSAIGQWRPLNPALRDPVQGLFIANMDADDNIDDILRLDRSMQSIFVNGIPYIRVSLTWQRSKNGIEQQWEQWGPTYTMEYPQQFNEEFATAFYGFAGKLGEAPGGGTMVTDERRMGRFFSASEPVAPSWTSTFPY